MNSIKDIFYTIIKLKNIDESEHKLKEHDIIIRLEVFVNFLLQSHCL